MFTIYLHAKYHMPGSNGSLAIGTKPKAGENFTKAVLFLINN
jgi:hypothetical protein